MLGTSTASIRTSTVNAVQGTGACGALIGSYLRSGSKGAEVLKLQAFLNNTQGAKLPTTGTFGPMTTAAVKAFQKKFGISQVGTIGPLTMAKINTVNCGGVLPAAAVNAIPTTPAPTTLKAPVKKTSSTPKPKVTEQPQTPAPTSSSTTPKKKGWFSNFFGGSR